MYITSKGDTFESISRKSYGSPAYAALIQSANPGVSLSAGGGVSIAIPPIGEPETPAWEGRDETVVNINGRRFTFWQTLMIERSVDQVRTVTFSAPFEPVRKNFREEFRPFTYPKCTLAIAGQTVFTGVVVGFELSEGLINVSCYSLPGVLADCTLPPSALPAEYLSMPLSEITRSVVKPFGIQVISKDGSGAAFEQVSCKPGDNVLDFIVSLAQQRARVVTDDDSGRLVIQKAVSKGASVATLKQGVLPLVSVAPTLDGREYYSHISGVVTADIGLDGSVYTVKNTHLVGAFRPHTYSVEDTENGSLRDAVRSKMGRMFGSAIQYKAVVASWRDPSGALWTPGTFLLLTYPDVMVYTEYKFVVRSVTLIKQADSATAELTLCLPGAFTGEIPERLPWD